MLGKSESLMFGQIQDLILITGEKRMKTNKDHVEENKPFTWESFMLSES